MMSSRSLRGDKRVLREDGWKTHQGPDAVWENVAWGETTPYRSIQNDNRCSVLNDLGRMRKISRMRCVCGGTHSWVFARKVVDRIHSKLSVLKKNKKTKTQEWTNWRNVLCCLWEGLFINRDDRPGESGRERERRLKLAQINLQLESPSLHTHSINTSLAQQ